MPNVSSIIHIQCICVYLMIYVHVNVCVRMYNIIHTCAFKCIYTPVQMITIAYVYSEHNLSALPEACS